jgi:hypothetical protein
LFYFVETVFFASQADLELINLLLYLPEYWDYRLSPPYPAQAMFS